MIRRTSIAALMVAAAAAATGCGADDISPDAVAEAAKATTDAGSSRVYIETTAPMPGGGEPVEITGDGAIDMAARRGEITMDLGAIPGGTGEMETVFEGFVMWMRAPFFGGRLPGGAEWIKIDLAKTSEELGFDVEQFTQLGGDPTKQLDYLRATGEVEKEGEEDVRGVSTTHYSGTMDLREYPDLLPAGERARAREGVEAMIDLIGKAEQEFDVWIDEDDLVRRMRMNVPVRQGSETVETEIVQEFYDFGVEVDVDPPPADDVVDITEFAAEAARRQRGG